MSARPNPQAYETLSPSNLRPTTAAALAKSLDGIRSLLAHTLRADGGGTTRRLCGADGRSSLVLLIPSRRAHTAHTSVVIDSLVQLLVDLPNPALLIQAIEHCRQWVVEASQGAFRECVRDLLGIFASRSAATVSLVGHEFLHRTQLERYALGVCSFWNDEVKCIVPGLIDETDVYIAVCQILKDGSLPLWDALLQVFRYCYDRQLEAESFGTLREGTKRDVRKPGDGGQERPTANAKDAQHRLTRRDLLPFLPMRAVSIWAPLPAGISGGARVKAMLPAFFARRWLALLAELGGVGESGSALKLEARQSYPKIRPNFEKVRLQTGHTHQTGHTQKLHGLRAQTQRAHAQANAQNTCSVRANGRKNQSNQVLDPNLPRRFGGREWWKALKPLTSLQLYCVFLLRCLGTLPMPMSKGNSVTANVKRSGQKSRGSNSDEVKTVWAQMFGLLQSNLLSSSSAFSLSSDSGLLSLHYMEALHTLLTGTSDPNTSSTRTSFSAKLDEKVPLLNRLLHSIAPTNSSVNANSATLYQLVEVMKKEMASGKLIRSSEPAKQTGTRNVAIYSKRSQPKTDNKGCQILFPDGIWHRFTFLPESFAGQMKVHQPPFTKGRDRLSSEQNRDGLIFTYEAGGQRTCGPLRLGSSFYIISQPPEKGSPRPKNQSGKESDGSSTSAGEVSICLDLTDAAAHIERGSASFRYALAFREPFTVVGHSLSVSLPPRPTESHGKTSSSSQKKTNEFTFDFVEGVAYNASDVDASEIFSLGSRWKHLPDVPTSFALVADPHELKFKGNNIARAEISFKTLYSACNGVQSLQTAPLTTNKNMPDVDEGAGIKMKMRLRLRLSNRGHSVQSGRKLALKAENLIGRVAPYGEEKGQILLQIHPVEIPWPQNPGRRLQTQAFFVQGISKTQSDAFLRGLPVRRDLPADVRPVDDEEEAPESSPCDNDNDKDNVGDNHRDKESHDGDHRSGEFGFERAPGGPFCSVCYPALQGSRSAGASECGCRTTAAEQVSFGSAEMLSDLEDDRKDPRKEARKEVPREVRKEVRKEVRGTFGRRSPSHTIEEENAWRPRATGKYSLRPRAGYQNLAARLRLLERESDSETTMGYESTMGPEDSMGQPYETNMGSDSLRGDGARTRRPNTGFRTVPRRGLSLNMSELSSSFSRDSAGENWSAEDWPAVSHMGSRSAYAFRLCPDRLEAGPVARSYARFSEFIRSPPPWQSL